MSYTDQQRVATILLVAGLGLPSLGFAQESAPLRWAALADESHEVWRWTQYTDRQGVPSEPVRQLVETQDGILWIATDSQVAYHDGYVWITPPRDPEMLPFRVQQIAPGRGDEIFVLTDDEILRADHSGYRSTPIGRNLRVRDLVADGDAVLAVVRYRGDGRERLVRYDATGYPAGEPDSGHQLRIPHDLQGAIRRLWRSGAGDIWLSSDRALYRRIDEGWIAIIEAPGLVVTDLAHEVGTPALVAIEHPAAMRGLWTVDSNDVARQLDIGAGGHVRALATRGEAGRVITFESRLVLASRGGEWRSIPATPPSLWGAEALHLTPDGDLWTIAGGALHRFSASPSAWQARRFRGTDLRNTVNTVAQRADGTTWTGTDSGIVIYEASGEVRSIDSIDGTRLGRVTGLVEDGAGNVWVSGQFSGLFVIEGGQVWRRVAFASDEALGFVDRLTVDGRGDLWLAGVHDAGGGDIAAAFVHREGTFERWAPPGSVVGGVSVVQAAPSGERWFADGHRLSRFRDGRWTEWGPETGLLGDPVTDLEITDAGDVWFTHGDNTLGRIDSDDRVQYRQPGRRLLGLRVNDISVGDGESLWLATSLGLVYFADDTWSLLGGDTGVSTTVMTTVQFDSDRVIAGTAGGGVEVLTRSAVATEPRARLDGLSIEGRGVRASWHPVTRNGALAGVAAAARYRVDDADWSEWRFVGELAEDGLSLGDHVLQVQVADALLRGGPIVTQRFAVPSPFATDLGYILPIAVLATVVALLVAVRWMESQRQSARLLESEKRYARLVDQASDVVFTLDIDGRISSVNRAGEALFGHPDERDMTIHDVVASDWALVVRRMIFEGLEGQGGTYELEMQGADGRFVPLEVKTRPVRQHGMTVEIQGIGRDITDRKRAEMTLRALAVGLSAERGEGFFKALAESLATELDAAHVLITATDDDVDGHARSLAFWSDGELREPIEVTTEGTPCERLQTGAVASWASGVADRFPEDRLLRDLEAQTYVGTALADSEGRTLGFMAVISDRPLENLSLAKSMLQIFAVRAATELERMGARRELLLKEEEFRQAQKMEAIGRLAGGIAHDFNNHLGVVTGYADLLMARLGQDDPMRADVEEIAQAGQRAAEMIQHLMTLGRRQERRTSALAPAEILSEIETFIRRLIGDDIDLRTEIDEHIGLIDGDATQLEQTILNLVVNARDAMPEGGPLTISLRRENVERSFPCGQPCKRPGDYVVLEVADAGTGMDEETTARIFEPFFTTKEAGKGTGLGLSTVRSMVEDAGGNIAVRSRPGAGTTFAIHLPGRQADHRVAGVPESRDRVA